MFARIMAVVLTVILLLTAVLSGIGWVTLKNQQTEGVMETLRTEAREIAYLAAQRRTNLSFFDRTDNSQQQYIQWKAREIYDEYGAYILVVDRTGRVMDNMNVAYADNPDFAKTLDRQDIMEALSRVLNGEEIELHVNVDGNDYFTVGIPFVQNRLVLGAVFMQTPAQVIEAGASDLLLPVISVAGAASVFAGLVLFIILRSVMKPLARLTDAARAMAEGDFAVRVPETKSTREVEELSAAFNSMADELSEVEDSRREFVANVSHELRSPITAISGYIEGMLDGTIPEEGREHYLSIVSDESKRLSHLIGELLALSRLERDDVAIECTDFDICDLLERVFLRRSGDLEKRVATERFRGRDRVAAGGQIRGRVAADGAVFRVEGPFDAELRAEFGPTFEERRERFFAVANEENVDEIGHNLRRRGGGASGDDQRRFERTIDAAKRNPGEVEHRQHVRITKLVLEREAEEVERGERRERFERVNREVRVAEDRLHIETGAKGAFASEIGATVDDVVKNRQRDVRHADRINVRKTEAHARFHRVGGFDDLTDFAADVLTGEANVREKEAFDRASKFRVEKVGRRHY
ncbi:MAG: HAMP domain-containing protein [Thermoguttaceae bacterium]|nr:HAMP domain-containing protein [Thermoguttaceae bacterium]